MDKNCVKNGCQQSRRLLRRIVRAWLRMNEADRHYSESTQTKATAVAMAVRFDDLMKAARQREKL